MISSAPRVSVVVPAYNEEKAIRQCVLAALDQTVPAHEIIVVDNRSTDRTAAIVAELAAEHPSVRLIEQHAVQGLIPTRNAGLDAATGDVLGRIDADSLLEPTWVEEVAAAFCDETVDAATGPVAYYDMPLRRFGLKADDRIRQLMLRLSNEYHFLFGSNMALRADAWRTIRDEVCLDEDDQFHEDIDISLHLAEAGLRARYVPTMVSGMSARRLEDSPRDYQYYVWRFERTYARHNVRSRAVRAPMWVYLAIYPPLKIIRSVMARREQLAERAARSGAALPPGPGTPPALP
ncbi:glycosyltransferase [Arenivirga flava]|nr:glycosyltransferase family 2 protein [Arenivirga flava]